MPKAKLHREVRVKNKTIIYANLQHLALAIISVFLADKTTICKKKIGLTVDFVLELAVCLFANLWS